MTDELHHYATCGASGDIPPMGDPEGPELLRELGSELGLDLAAGRDAADRERLARRYEAKAVGFERWEPRCVAEAVAAGIRHMMRVDEEI